TAMGELNQIVQSDTMYAIEFSHSGGVSYSPSTKVIHINTRSDLKVKSTDEIQSPAIGAAHEISHAAQHDRIGNAQYIKNAWLDRPITVTLVYPPPVSPEEQRAVRVENKVIDEVGGTAHRKGYYDTVDKDITTCGATSTQQC